MSDYAAHSCYFSYCILAALWRGSLALLPLTLGCQSLDIFDSKNSHPSRHLFSVEFSFAFKLAHPFSRASQSERNVRCT
jgi:hypothetical protein